MHRIALTAVVTLVALALCSPAMAFQCPTLVKKVQDETARRFDPAAASAKQLAAESAALHAAGKHAEAEAKGKEALAKLGMQS
ncbi:MAG TPA: hypothetical protein VFL90_20035 [Methylomirabilota bacterium]|nr:hypothetical protein [Methylomirabilota bacterium]